MAKGASGTFLISWAQAELDGLMGTDPSTIAVGSTWRWSGHATRVDDPRDILVLENGVGAVETRRRAAHRVRKFLGDPDKLFGDGGAVELEQPLFRHGFEITDGRVKYQVSLIEIDGGQRPMLLFLAGLPPADRDLWIVSCTLPGIVSNSQKSSTATVCFVPTTWIKTPNGSKQVQDLQEGDLICTKDNGDQAIRWIGSRNINGGRLMAMPYLRPIKIAAHVLADGEPDQDLVVSPDHRVLVKGPVAQTLFNTSEVLVAARDLVNDTTIQVDYGCRSVSYVHLMLDQHQIVWANGVEVESFHPAAMAPENISIDQRDSLWQRFPDIQDDAFSYGEFARRNLTRSEAAILSYGAYSGH